MISNGDPLEYKYMYLCDKIQLPGVLRSKTLKEWENSINIFPLRTRAGRHGVLMVSAFDSAACGPGSNPGRGHCVVFLGKTLTVRLH